MAKKNLRKIPPKIWRRLDRIDSQDVVVAYLGTYSAEDITRGRFRHLEIALAREGLKAPSSVLPPANSGKFSDYNINGREIRRDDLPKEKHYNSIETPNWGDSSNGYHTVDLPYERYPRDFIAPGYSRIKITCPHREAGRNSYAIAFEVERVLHRSDPKFESQLLETLNLLQENIGACGIEKSGATISEYERSLMVAWEILPPGTKEETVERVYRGRTPSEGERKVVEDRYDFLMKFHPAKLVYGTSGFQRYFGALLQDDLVIFENVEYGNAIYIMFDGWAELSQRSRTELLSGRYGDNFERILHISGWKNRVKKIVKEHIAANAR